MTTTAPLPPTCRPILPDASGSPPPVRWAASPVSLNFPLLGYIGTQPPNPALNLTAQIGTLLYLAFFLLMPLWSRLGTFKPVPERVTFHAH